MNETDYLKMTQETATERNRYDLQYLVFGLCSESGEIADLMKKALSNGRAPDRAALLKELGDVNWYVTRLIDTLGSTPGEIRDLNSQKLRARQAQGTLVSREGRTDT